MTLLARRDLNILEIGWGQGQFLSVALSAVPVDSTAAFYGLDGADVAISQAETRDPRITWIADSLQRFLVTHDRRVGEHRYDLIIDRGGSAFVSSEDEATVLQNGLQCLLRPAGIFLYMISRSFHHEKAPPIIYRDWSSDWLTMLKARFPHYLDMSDEYTYLIAGVPRG